MQFERTEVSGVILIRPTVFVDTRGEFFEFFEERKFAAAGISARFVQANHSRSIRNTLRGLHYQIRQSQGKLVRVVSGEVFDVAVDLRRSSPTFGHSIGMVLSESNRCMLWVPPGFAHGFLALSDSADFIYHCTDFWAPDFERSIVWNDADLAIPWPLPKGFQPELSKNDAAGVRFLEAEYFP